MTEPRKTKRRPSQRTRKRRTQKRRTQKRRTQKRRTHRNYRRTRVRAKPRQTGRGTVIMGDEYMDAFKNKIKEYASTAGNVYVTFYDTDGVPNTYCHIVTVEPPDIRFWKESFDGTLAVLEADSRELKKPSYFDKYPQVYAFMMNSGQESPDVRVVFTRYSAVESLYKMAKATRKNSVSQMGSNEAHRATVLALSTQDTPLRFVQKRRKADTFDRLHKRLGQIHEFLRSAETTLNTLGAELVDESLAIHGCAICNSAGQPLPEDVEPEAEQLRVQSALSGGTGLLTGEEEGARGATAARADAEADAEAATSFTLLMDCIQLSDTPDPEVVDSPLTYDPVYRETMLSILAKPAPAGVASTEPASTGVASTEPASAGVASAEPASAGLAPAEPAPAEPADSPKLSSQQVTEYQVTRLRESLKGSFRGSLRGSLKGSFRGSLRGRKTFTRYLQDMRLSATGEICQYIAWINEGSIKEYFPQYMALQQDIGNIPLALCWTGTNGWFSSQPPINGQYYLAGIVKSFGEFRLHFRPMIQTSGSENQVIPISEFINKNAVIIPA